MKFIIPGEPKPQGRPRFSRFGGFVRAFDPQESKDFKSRVAIFAKQTGFFEAERALWVKCSFYLKRPKRLYRKRDPSEAILQFAKPDIDNLIKAITDGMKGIVYRDDSQIQTIIADKFYHEKGGSSRAEVEIKLI